MTLADEMRRRGQARGLLADQMREEMREEMREDQAARLNVRSWIVWLFRLLRGGA